MKCLLKILKQYYFLTYLYYILVKVLSKVNTVFVLFVIQNFRYQRKEMYYYEKEKWYAYAHPEDERQIW